MATYWENSCSFGLRYVSWCKCLVVSLVFSHLGFWSGSLFLVAPFPDLCLLVPFCICFKCKTEIAFISNIDSMHGLFIFQTKINTFAFNNHICNYIVLRHCYLPFQLNSCSNIIIFQSDGVQNLVRNCVRATNQVIYNSMDKGTTVFTAIVGEFGRKRRGNDAPVTGLPELIMVSSSPNFQLISGK